MRDADDLEQTMAEQAVRRLQSEIVAGRLEPLAKLRIEELKRITGIGASPLREALARLTSLGFVRQESHRGFYVAGISKTDLLDLTRIRQMVEAAALADSLAQGGAEWESEIVAAFARLKWALEQQRSADSLDVIELMHHRFHRALLAGCRSGRLLDMHEQYYKQALRYRIIVFNEIDHLQDFLARHERLMQAVLSREPQRAGAEMAAHLALSLGHAYPE